MKTGHIGIVGGGALGIIYAGLLAGSQAIHLPIHLVTRQPDVLEAREHGLGVLLPGLTKPTRLGPESVTVVHPDDLGGAAGACDLVLMLSRSYESDYAMAQASHMLAPDGCVVTLQNGLSGWDRLREAGLRYVAGVTFTGGHRTAPDTAVCSRLSDTVLGNSAQHPGDATELATFLNAASVPARVGGDEAVVIWRKILITSVNWLCASVGAPAKDIIPLPEARTFLLDVMAELMPIAASDGAELDWVEQVGDLDRFFAEGGNAIGSAYEALRQGQKLEIEEICQSVLVRAANRGIPAPRTASLSPLLSIQSRVFKKERDRWARK